MPIEIIPAHVMTTPEAAKALGIKPYQLEYKLRNQALPEAALRVGGRRLFTQDEIENLRTILAAKTQQGEVNCSCSTKEVSDARDSD